MTRVQCPTCHWENENPHPAEAGRVLHSAIVHAVLKPGHEAVQIADLTPAERRERSRRAVLLTRAIHNPEGMTPYEFTKGMTKADALLFWTDAKALGFVTLGRSDRGARTFGLRSEVVA